MAVTLINAFEVPAGREPEFLGLWQQVNAYMQTKPGYLRHALHRALTPEASFRFINVAQWASRAQFDAAHDEGFRALVGQPSWAPFRYHPFLYEVVHEGHADPASDAA
jgi:heme-degrading monooxygenase HmoA